MCPALLCLYLTGCDFEDEYNVSPRRNFESLWKIIDENYCFFEYKNVNWDNIYSRYSPEIEEQMSDYDLFRIMSDMLDELQDGHVNLLSSNVGISSYDGWLNGYPSNFNTEVLRNTYWSRSQNYNDIVKHNRIVDNQIGYIYYGSFKESILEKDLDNIFSTFSYCKGIIIDVRDNGGGSITNSDRLASRFLNEKTLCGYIRHKTGKGHDDFSDPYPIYLTPSHGYLWLKPVIVITNRKCYSATNNFVSKMKVLPSVTILGGRTGGGSGFPFTSELPNGWSIRFSTSPILDVDKQHTEFGIEPDIEVDLTDEDIKENKDTLIEEAVRILLN
jgi:hypothetical protein